MPGKHVNMDPSSTGRLCKRCGVSESSIVVRSEPICRDCFMKYVHTKVIKRMGTFRVRHSTVGKQRKLLLPLSLGVSSITLLYILDHYLQLQAQRSGRTGFTLHVLLVDTSSVDNCSPNITLLARVKERFPEHTYNVLPLADVLDKVELSTILDGQLQGKPKDAQDTTEPAQSRLDAFLLSIPSATSRADVISTLRTRLIVHTALENDCEAVLWGDSTTRLAERTLADTAKGRGFSLAWQTNDGTSPHGIAFYYPVRELLKKELVAHAALVSPSLTLLVDSRSSSIQVSASAKDTTIDQLMTQYFESVEENYPSIVANVVRTSSKLVAVPAQYSDTACRLCNMPVSEDVLGRGWGGDQMDVVALPQQPSTGFCYGCARSVPQQLVP